jgi:hypothetical protein
MMTGREVVGTFEHDNLFSGTTHSVDVCQITIVAGAKHTRGELMGVNNDGECDILGTEGYTAAYVLAEDADATDRKVVATAYRSGGYNRNALIVKDRYTLSATDEKTLRDAGIYLDNMMM